MYYLVFSSFLTHRQFQSPFQIAMIRRVVFAITGLCTCLCVDCSLFAGEKTDDVDYPLFVINAASFQRLRDSAGLMFESAERLDMTDQLDQRVITVLKETQGLDRSRPFGAMFYLSPELIGAPIAISYLPVSNLDDALATLANETGQVLPIEGNQTRHDIQYGESFRLRTLFRNGYLFLVGPDGGNSALERNFPEPEKLTSQLSSQYDLAISMMIKRIPPALKTLFLAHFASQSRGHLQQRDDEPESVYRLRRANGEFWIELIDRIISQGEEFTLGARTDHEKRLANIDLEIAGTKNSKLAKFFQGMTGKRTYFGNLLSNPSTFTMSVSLLLEEKQRKLFVTYFEAASRDLHGFSEKDEAAELVKLVDPIFITLITTAEIGHFDAIAQLTGNSQGEFSLLAGVKLASSRGLPEQLANTFQYLQDHPNGNELLTNMEVSLESIDTYPVHRVPINPPDKGGQRMFGENADLYVHASHQAIWCSFGGDAALDSLRDAIQAVGLPQDVQQTRNRVPFLFITHAKNWLTVSDEEDPKAVLFNEQAQASFESNNDEMKLEIRPTESGVRLRVEFEAGYISLLGRGISKGIETGFFTPRSRGERERQQGQPGTPDKTDKEPAQTQN